MGKMRKRRKFFKLFSCLGRQADEAVGVPEVDTVSGSSPPVSSIAAVITTAREKDGGAAASATLATSGCRTVETLGTTVGELPSS
jgi:hypothetical protein